MDPTYLIIRSRAPYARFARFVERQRGLEAQLVAARGMHELKAWEPGSVPMHTFIARFDSMEQAREAWATMDLHGLLSPEPPLTLAARAVPDEGFPPEMSFVPTHMNVVAGASQPPTLMLIEGTGRDQEKMDTYRDIILPMMRERGSFYLCFELGGAVEVLSGEWDESIFAISRWPMPYLAESFWLSDTYQDTAIPLRLDVGNFSVVTLEGERDDFSHTR